MNLQTWLRLYRLPGESTERATERYAANYGLDASEKQDLVDENQNRETEELAETGGNISISQTRLPDKVLNTLQTQTPGTHWAEVKTWQT